MEAHRQVLGMTAEAYRAELRRLYNGYRFWLDEGENIFPLPNRQPPSAP